MVNVTKSIIARKLIIYIVLFSTCITLVITALQLYRDYNRDLKVIESDLNQIESVHLSTLTASLWSSNIKLLNSGITGLKEIRDIEYVEIYDGERVWVTAGELKGKSNIIHEYPMVYTHRGKEVKIGVLKVAATLDGVYQRLLDKVWVILVSNGIKTSLVAIFMYFLFYHLIAKHIEKITRDLKYKKDNLKDKKLYLDRNNTKSDELDYLVESINELHENLHEQVVLADEQKQRLSQTLNSIGDAVITTDLEGLVSRMNPVAEYLTGWSNDEALGKPIKSIFSIVNSETNKAIENPIEHVIGTGEVVHLSNHTTLFSKTGKKYYISDSAAPIKDGDKILGMVLVFNDITEQYLLRETAAKSKRDLQSIMDNSPAVVYVKDISGIYTFINKKFEEAFNLTHHEIIGHSDLDIFPEEYALRIIEQDKEVIAYGKAFEIEEVVPQKDGIHTFNSIKFPMFNNKGEIYAVCGISNDITGTKKVSEALRESELRFRQLAQNLKEVFWVGSPDWSEVYYVSPSYETEWQLDAEKLYKDGHAWLQVIHPSDKDKVMAKIPTDINSIGEYVDFDEYRIIRPDGSIIWVQARAYPVRDEHGEVIRIAGIAEDITTRKSNDEIIRRTQKMDALGKLTGGVAHDYNNMLGVIMGYSELLQDMLTEQPELKKFAHEIFHAGERGAKLTKKLLSFSRKLPSDAKVINLNKILNEQQLMLEKTLTAKINLSLNISDDLWPVCVDANDFEDAIINICINAMHAMQGEGLLSIETFNVALTRIDAENMGVNSGEHVLVRLSDTGCGMDESTLENIFEPFFSTKGELGTGLGLSQVYGFVSRNNGAIYVDSIINKGTSINLYFPKYQDNKQRTKTIEDSSLELSGKETILIVDDEPSLVNLASNILRAKGYKVFGVGNAKDALLLLQDEQVDLVLTDVIMPEVDGYQLANEINALYPNIKIQMASGYSDERHVKTNNTDLKNNLLNKPFTAKELLMKVRTLLDD